MSSQTTAAKNLIEFIKETLRKNLVVSVKNGNIKLDDATLSSVMSLVNSSFDEGMMNGMYMFERQLAEKK